MPFKYSAILKCLYLEGDFTSGQNISFFELGQKFFISWFTGIFFSDLGSGWRKNKNK